MSVRLCCRIPGCCSGLKDESTALACARRFGKIKVFSRAVVTLCPGRGLLVVLVDIIGTKLVGAHIGVFSMETLLGTVLAGDILLR